MAFRLDCDVEGCTASEPLAVNATTAPLGWRVIEVYDQAAQAPSMFGLLAATQARGHSYYVCPNHELPAFRGAAKAVKAPDWVGELLGALGTEPK